MEELKDDSSVVNWIKEKKIDLVINIPEGFFAPSPTKSFSYLLYLIFFLFPGSTRRDEVTSGYLIRRTAVDFGCSLLTNIKCAILFVEALERNRALPCISAEEFIGVQPTDVF